MAKKNNASQRRAAKNAKRKNKPKQSASERRNTYIYKAVTDVFNRLYFTGSSTTRGVRTHNLKRLGALLKDADFLIGEQVIKEKLRNEEITWYFWIGVFSDDGDEIWCDPLLADVADCTVSDFDAIITPMIENHINDVMEFQKEKFGESFAKGYGWVATPTYTCDLGASEESFVNFFMERDVTNESKRKEIVADYTASLEIDIEEAVIGDDEALQAEAQLQYSKLKRMHNQQRLRTTKKRVTRAA